MKKSFLKRYSDYINNNPKGYWFKKKIFGWGWTPVKWQGFLVLGIFLLAVVLDVFIFLSKPFPSKTDFLSFFILLIILGIFLIIICYQKGEKPSWSWGFPKTKKHK